MDWNDYMDYIQLPSGDGVLLYNYSLIKKHTHTSGLLLKDVLKKITRSKFLSRLEMRKENIREVECLSKIWQVHNTGTATTSQAFWLPDERFTSKINSNYVVGQLCFVILENKNISSSHRKIPT